MRAVLQRVSQAKVEVDGECSGSIGGGLVVLLGVSREDSEQDAQYLADKITKLRIFTDSEGKMNRSVLDTGGSLLVISQFTLYGDCRKGRRPSFDRAAPPAEARHLYVYFIEQVKLLGIPVATGVFQAEMHVSLTNIGPVTLIIDSKKIEIDIDT